MKLLLTVVVCAASLAAHCANRNELLAPNWGEAYGGGSVRETAEGRVFVSPKPNSGVRGRIKVGEDWVAVRLSCEYRTKDVVAGEHFYSTARIVQQFSDAKGKRVGAWPNTLGAVGTISEWRKFSAKYIVPAGAKTYDLNFGSIARSGLIEYRNPSVKLVATKADLMPHDEPLPEDAKGEPFSLEDAWREKTASRERICLNGLWRARQVTTNETPDKIPAVGDCWGWMKVPHVWNETDQIDLLSPWFENNGVGTINEARWLKRQLALPDGIEGKRAVITFTMLNSKAVVFVDGKRTTEVTFPAGEADITDAIADGKSHEIALYVTAWPANWKEWTFDGALDEKTAASTDHAVAKNVVKKGITGDVYLDLIPKANRITEAYAECNVEKREITLVARTERPMGEGEYGLSAEIEGCGGKFSFAGKNALRITSPWPEAKLWDSEHPTNLYTCRITLTDGAGKVIDAALPFRFGFRDVKTQGRDLLVNGKAVHLRGLTAASWSRGAAHSCKESCLEFCRRLLDDGVNFVIAANYAVQPGQLTYIDAFLDACDETGMMFSVTLPHVREFDWAIDTNAERRKRFTQLTEWMISRVRNHPSVIAYAMTHNRVGYCGDINPDKLDGRCEFTEGQGVDWFVRKQKTARAGSAIARSIDPTRPIYHHEGGNLDDFHCCNIYLNWAPTQERSEWIRDWAERGTKPLIFVEWGMPHVASWSSYRGPLFIWTRPAFQSIWSAEYASAFRNDAAFDASEFNHAALAAEERAWATREPFYYGRKLLPAVRAWRANCQQLQAEMLKRNLTDFRAWGITEFLPWDSGGFYSLATKRDIRDNPKAYVGLKSPGIVSDRFPQQGTYWYDTNERSDFQLTEVGKVWREGNRSLLGFIGGEGVFTDRRHGYRVGERIRKTLVAVNDLTGEVEVAWKCSFGGEKLEGKTTVSSGKTAFVPVEFSAKRAGAEELLAEFRFGNGEVRQDAFGIDVYPEPKTKKESGICLYDPKGKTAENFRRLGIDFKLVDATLAVGADSGETFVYESGSGAEQMQLSWDMRLVIGRECLTPTIMNRLVVPAARSRARVLVFEQNRETLESVGFRVQEYGLRNAFPRYRDGEVASAADARCLHDWAGEATLLSPRLSGLDKSELSYPRQMANGFYNWHVWRCGCRGNVASVIIEKPAMGDWKARVDGGFNLQYSPLLEWTIEQGSVTFCQLDVTARTVVEPAADDIVRELVGSLGRKVSGRKQVQALGMDAILAVRDYGVGNNPDPLKPWNEKQVLVASSGAKRPEGFAKAIERGATALCLGFTAEEIGEWSPVKLKVAETNGCHYTRIEKLPPELNGLSNADWAWHGAMDFAAFTEATEEGNSAFRVVRHGKGKVIFWQVPPWKIDDRAKPYLRVSRRRADAMLARLIHNLEVASKVYGVHYMDAPIAEDDPYRYVRW